MSKGKDNYKKMAEQLRDAPLSELLPDFDKDAVWNELEPGIPRRKLLPIPYPRYVAVAAVLLVLITMGLWQGQNSAPIIVAKQDAEAKVTPSVQAKDKAVVASPANNAVAVVKPVHPRTHVVRKAPQPDLPITITEPVIKDTAIRIAEVIMPVDSDIGALPVLPRRKVRAVHLTDVGQEMKSMVIKEPAPQSFGEKVGYFMYGETLPEKDDNSPAGLRSLFEN